jgi:hypothetical protein
MEVSFAGRVDENSNRKSPRDTLKEETAHPRKIPSIASIYRACLLYALELQHLFTESGEGIWAAKLQDDVGRLRVWAADTGANRTGRVSLDHRLREAPSTHAMVRDFLQELYKLLGEGVHMDSSLLTQDV